MAVFVRKTPLTHQKVFPNLRLPVTALALSARRRAGYMLFQNQNLLEFLFLKVAHLGRLQLEALHEGATPAEDQCYEPNHPSQA